MACKTYGETPEDSSDLSEALFTAYKNYCTVHKGSHPKVADLLSAAYLPETHKSKSDMLLFSADDMVDLSVESEKQLKDRYADLARKFVDARAKARENTDLYLSMVTDLDIYVATSMRTRDDFRKMATRCESVFTDSVLADLHLRYFDPTMSAAEGHHDKGLIECLMVKCARLLLYCAGDKESYGKDAEAAMALSQGKFVIFLCDEATRSAFYRDVHPLSRLIHFDTGVAVGAIVTSKEAEVVEIIRRIYANEMEYELVKKGGSEGYLHLKETLTGSIIRLQTDDRLLSKAFWNYYKRMR
jgi:hypothetical protein